MNRKIHWFPIEKSCAMIIQKSYFCVPLKTITWDWILSVKEIVHGSHYSDRTVLNSPSKIGPH